MSFLQGDGCRSRCLSPEGSAARPASAGNRPSPSGRTPGRSPTTSEKLSAPSGAGFRTPDKLPASDKPSAAAPGLQSAAKASAEKRASAERPGSGKKAAGGRGSTVPLHADAASSGAHRSRTCAGTCHGYKDLMSDHQQACERRVLLLIRLGVARTNLLSQDFCACVGLSPWMHTPVASVKGCVVHFWVFACRAGSRK